MHGENFDFILSILGAQTLLRSSDQQSIFETVSLFLVVY